MLTFSLRQQRFFLPRVIVGFLIALNTLTCIGQDAVPAPRDTITTPENLTVMTWNLEWFFDEHVGDNFSDLAKEKTAPSRDDWNWHRDAVAQSISKAKPTILALQEIENRRVLWYLARSLDRDHKIDYTELCDESADHFTEQDVGFLFREPADVLSRTHFSMTRELRATKQYYDLSKHILGVFQIPTGDGKSERVTVMNIHWRSRAEGVAVRIRQARLTHHWLRDIIASGENVILLGDTNSEENGDETRPTSDLGIACGLETDSKVDDLVDLHLRLSPADRRTHLLPNKQFDRIMVSRSLLDDDPDRPDLVFSSIKVRRDLCIQGDQDTQEQHWDLFWKRDAKERDLSDHYPVEATFEIR